MKNEFIDVSIATMVGNLPDIINRNFKYVSDEFDSIRKETNSLPEIIVDVSSNNVYSVNGKFNTITIGTTQLTNDIIQNFNSSLNTMAADIKELKYGNTTISTTYGAARNRYSSQPVNEKRYSAANNLSADEIDMTSFFTTSAKGRVQGITVNDLYKKNLYRTIDGLKVPLKIGTVVSGSKMRLSVYHDHIDMTGSAKVVERVYSVVVNGPDGVSVVQYGSADTVIISMR